MLAEIHSGMGDLQAAIDCSEQASVIHRQTGQQIGEARALGVLGGAYAAAGDLAGAGLQ